MGIFNKTEEELQKSEESKKINALKNEIARNNSLKPPVKHFLCGYLMDIQKGLRKNDFFEVDFLIQIIRQLEFDNYQDTEKALSSLKQTIDSIMTAGIETPDYEYLKAIILNNLIGKDGFVNQGIFDQSFYYSFGSISDYIEVMKIINSNITLKKNFKIIKEYASKISRYIIDASQYKRNIIATLQGFSSVVDKAYQEYLNNCYLETLKSIGIYSVDEKGIALINDNMEQIGSYMESLQYYKGDLDRAKQELETLISSGKKSIDLAYRQSLEKLKKEIEIAQTEIIKRLDERLLELEDEMKRKSDDTFNDILIEYRKKIHEFRTMFNGYSEATSRDLIRIQKAAEESIGQLQDAVNNNPQLEKLLTKANEDNKLRDTLISLMQRKESIDSKLSSGEDKLVIIPGDERIIMPASPSIIVPDNPTVSRTLIRAFDDSIPFNKRFEEILKKKEEKEKNGEIYHAKTDDIIRDIMEGDWPYLWGPSGCGKSHLMKQVAELIGIKLVKNGKITEPYTVMGFNDPQGRFRATQAYYAVIYGYLLGLDEFDNGNQDTIVVINEIYSALLDSIKNPMEKYYITFAEDVPAIVNPNFRLIAGGNTPGDGENLLFSSRGKVDESVQERMSPIFINYDNRVEKRIFGSFSEWYDFFVKFRLACEEYAKKARLDFAPGIGTTRDAEAISRYILHNSKSLDQIISERFVQTKNENYRQTIGRFIASEYGLDYDGIKQSQPGDNLSKIKAKTIAREFVYQCKRGIR